MSGDRGQVMRAGIILSAAVHGLLWALLAFAGPRPFHGTAEQAIEVAIVSANDMPKPQGAKPAKSPLPELPAPPKAEAAPEAPVVPPKPVEAASQPHPPQSPPQMPQSFQPMMQPAPEPPKPEQSIPDAGSLAAMLMLPAPGNAKEGFDGQSERSAKLTAADIAAFKEHLRRCAKLPAAMASDTKLKVVIRVALKPDATLAGPPALMAASASPHGPALVTGAIAALTACQPYLELPAAKYKEWKVLDVTLRPQDLIGG